MRVLHRFKRADILADMNVWAIIESLGGIESVARGVKVARTTVYMWHSKGIPADRCIALSKLAKRRRRAEITLETLMYSRATGLKPKRPATAAKKHGGPRNVK